MSDCFESAYPRPLREAEALLVQQRRRFVNEGRADRAAPPPTASGSVAGMSGVALSGGGIRSATFCLGFFQALAGYGLMRRIDLMSTVSGGSYFGSFLGALVSRADKPRPPHDDVGVFAAERDLRNPHSEPLSWLRESGRYISPNGSGDEVLAGAVYIRNWVAIHVVLSTLVLAVLLGAQLVRAVAFRDFEAEWRAWTALAVWWSPFMILPMAVFLLAAVPLGWGYWFTQRSSAPMDWREQLPWLTGLAVLVACVLVLLGPWTVPTAVFRLAGILGWAAAAGLGLWAFAWLIADDPTSRTSFMRNRLSSWLAHVLWLVVGLLIFALADTAGQIAYEWLRRTRPPMAFNGLLSFSGLAALVTWARKLLLATGAGASSKRPKLSPTLAAGLAAFVIIGLAIVAISIVSHGFAWEGKVPNGVMSTSTLTWALLSTVVLSLLSGQSIKFLNLSSHQALYGARLTRAYLGASNRQRWRNGHQETQKMSGQKRNLTEVIAGDQVPLAEYAPHARGGPLHLINVTFNETLRGETQVEQRDRKGIPLAVGPCGLSAGVRHHALWGTKDGVKDCGWVKPVSPEKGTVHLFAGDDGAEHAVESLDLGGWVSISGAAFTTGLGARTSLGLSTLLGLANIRLGYWWDSHVRPSERDAARTDPGWSGRLAELTNDVFPVQTHLLQELLARFYGPNRRRWYLSDGGHFENTACYELIRRRVPWMLICDDGQDEAYSFQDVANLVRKARTDFQAEIVFLTREELDEHLDPQLRPAFGTLDDLRPGAGGDGRAPGFARAHAALAWVYYHDHVGGASAVAGDPQEASSIIMLVKPGLTGDEPLDVLEYKASHPHFPQESTADQYFDEAQWESYRKLGEHMGRVLFAPGQGTGWRPRSMRVLAPASESI